MTLSTVFRKLRKEFPGQTFCIDLQVWHDCAGIHPTQCALKYHISVFDANICYQYYGDTLEDTYAETTKKERERKNPTPPLSIKDVDRILDIKAHA